MYKLPIFLLSAVLCASQSYAADILTQKTFSTKPFSTTGRWITNADNVNLTYAGVNWPGHLDAMVPEGLQKASVADIVTKIKSIGMNAIRLTFAIQMVDEIYAKKDGSLETTFINALGAENGTEVLRQVLKANPTFTNATTRLEVFDAVAAECAKQGIYVHLDNHMSSAGWCCDGGDGNAWFGDNNFPIANWTRGLSYMADHGKKLWPSFISMGLRNELRTPGWRSAARPVNWDTWQGNMTAGAAAVRAANPDILIFFSGQYYDTQLRPLFTSGSSGNIDFNPIKLKLLYANKIVLEVHDYDLDEKNCTNKMAKLEENSFGALGPKSAEVVNVFPLVMSEWGYAQVSNEWKNNGFVTCLEEYLPEQRVGWMQWVLVGSYYVRQGKQGELADEPWGLLDSTGLEWRCPDCVQNGVEPMVRASLGLQTPVVASA
ncbi:MAG: hypothetical protein Q9168_005657 [Polycauliona sp. 1 TL-2023]